MWVLILDLFLVGMIFVLSICLGKVVHRRKKYCYEIRRHLIDFRLTKDIIHYHRTLRAVNQMGYNFWGGLECLKECQEREEK